jgi:formate hydrogenlyase subunit 4
MGGKKMKILIYMLIIIPAPFIFAGLINRVKALWAGRYGQPVLQPFYDFIKYMSKGQVISTATNPVFNAAQAVSAGAVIVASMLIPLCKPSPVFSVDYGFIVFAYLLGLSKFISLISAMDTGSSFEGMGASREASFTAFIEPSFFVIIATAAAVSGMDSFAGLATFAASNLPAGWAIAWLAAVAMLVMILTEGSRVPVDDPATHLELTMIHEAMVLDNSGPDMALINYTVNLKMVLLSAVIALIFTPAGASVGISALILACVLFLTAIITGCIESLMARLRMTHVPQFVFFMSSMAVIIFCSAFIFVLAASK